MSKTGRYIVIAIFAAVVGWFVIRQFRRQKWLMWLNSIGLDASQMKYDEIHASYIYLHDYATKYSTNAGEMLRITNPKLYELVKSISDRYHIFEL